MARQVSDRTRRYRALRRAGFSPAEARRFRDSPSRVAAIRAAKRRGAGKREAREAAARPIREVRGFVAHDRAVVKQRRILGRLPVDLQEREARWRKWSRPEKMPKDVRQVQTGIKRRMQQLGLPDTPETSKLAWGLTHESLVRGGFNIAELSVSIIEEYREARRARTLARFPAPESVMA